MVSNTMFPINTEVKTNLILQRVFIPYGIVVVQKLVHILSQLNKYTFYVPLLISYKYLRKYMYIFKIFVCVSVYIYDLEKQFKC